MKIIKPKYEILEQQYHKATLLEDMFKHIEICGRTCYKSEDKITDKSYEKFVKMLEDSEHGAMLEHGTVYLTIPLGTPVDDLQYMWKHDIVSFFNSNKYSVVKEKVVNQTVDVEIKGYGMRTQASAHFYYITTNWRVIFENRDKLLVKYFTNNFHTQKENFNDSVLQWVTAPTEYHEKRYTVRFTCDIGVSREFNRHRKDSIAEESTRFCNYLKDKFGGEVNIVKPQWVEINEEVFDIMKPDNNRLYEYCDMISKQEDKGTFSDIDYWLFANLASEYSYMNLIRLGWTPQKARTVLNLDTKTELIHTAYASDWKHFFELRALGTTGAPHPSAKELAYPLMEEFVQREYIEKLV